MNPSQSVNLQLSIEQVNHEANDSTTSSYVVNRSSPQPPLDNVVDPNTEFKRENTNASVSTSPEISFGLKDVLKELQSKNKVKSGSISELDTTHPLLLQLQQAYTAVLSTSSEHKNATLAPVHSPKKSSKQSVSRGEHTSNISSPAQVATILHEQEPQLVSEFLTLISNKDNSSISSNTMAGYKDLSEFTIEIPTTSSAPTSSNDVSHAVINIETENTTSSALTSPVLLGSKTLHKFPPGYVTVMTERGAAGTPEPQAQKTLASTSVPNGAGFFNLPSTSVEQWNNENNQAHYGSISNISDISLYNPERKNVPTSPTPGRSAEEVAWVMRNTRDQFETASNFSACSSNLDSICSERIDTMSMISDVSGYEEEMFRIKKLLLDPLVGRSKSKRAHFAPKFNPSEIQLLTPIVPSSSEIVATHGQGRNVKFEQDIVTMEKKFEDRIQGLLRIQANTDGRLEASREELERIIMERNELRQRIAQFELKQNVVEKSTNFETELETAQRNASQLEDRVKELLSQLQIREQESQAFENEKQAKEAEISRLRLEIEDLRLDTETKAASVQGLKAKVAEQHSELQKAMDAQLRASAAANQAYAEAQALRTSQAWYKDQLTKAQNARSSAQKAASSANNQLATKEAQFDTLRSHVVTLKQQLADAEHQAVREKRAMVQQLETFEADMVAREAEIAHRMSGGEIVEVSNPKETLKISQLETTCSDLQQQLENARSQIQAGEESAKQLHSDNDKLLGKIAALKNEISDKEVQLQLAADSLSSMDANNHQLKSEVSEQHKVLQEFESDNIKLRVALNAANIEKNEVNKAIETLNTEFSIVSKRYHKMKQDITEKELYITSVQSLLSESRKEKELLQEELSEVNLKIHGYSDTIQKEVDLLRDQIEKKNSEIDNLIQNNDVLKREVMKFKDRSSESELQVETQLQQNQELAGRIAELTAGKNKAERRCTKLQESLTFREDQLFNAQHGMEEAYTAARNADEKLKEMKKRVVNQEVEAAFLRSELGKSYLTAAELSHNQDEAKVSKVTGATQTDELFESDKENGVFVSEESVVVNIPTVESVSVELARPAMKDKGNNTDIISPDISESGCQTETISVEKSEEELQLQVTTLTEKLKNIETEENSSNSQMKGEISRLKGLLDKTEAQLKDLHIKYRSNVSTLLRTMKDHMRARKHAEKELVKVQEMLQQREGQNVESLNAHIAELHEKLISSTENLDALREAERANAEAMLELERERGRLEGASSSQARLHGRVMKLEAELASARFSLEESERERELNAARAAEQMQEVQQAVQSSAKMVQELHKQILNERRESSALRQQLTSLRNAVDAANHRIEIQRGQINSLTEENEGIRKIMNALETKGCQLQTKLIETEAQAKSLMHELQLSKEKDPLLADQMKRLSEVAKQRSSEAKSFKKALEKAEQRHVEETESMNASLAAAQEEIAALQCQLDEARKIRFSLQTLAAELRGALHASLEQGKMLKARLAAVDTAPQPRDLPDLTSSLPVPSTLDEEALAELLERSAAPPPPLTHLQSCLHSLQQEVDSLQHHLEQRGRSANTS